MTPTTRRNSNSRIVGRIAQVGGIPPYQTEPVVSPRGFSESETGHWQAGSDNDPMQEAVSAWRRGRNGVDAWVMRSRALENSGVLPGDVLVVDLNASPTDGDIVCAQLYNRAGEVETAFRIYEKPFLVAASSDPAFRRPTLIDGDRAQIKGVVVASLRGRASS